MVVSSANGLAATQKARDMIAAGADTLDAVVAGVNIVEDDPDDSSVGYGGLPNEEGVVELDAGVMDGRTHRAGDHIRGMPPVLRQPLQRALHVLGLHAGQIVHRLPRHQLAGDAGRGDRRPAPVGLEPDLDRPPPAHAQEEARQVPTALVLFLSHTVRRQHHASVAGVQEVIHQDLAVPHAPRAGIISRSLATSGSTLRTV